MKEDFWVKYLEENPLMIDEVGPWVIAMCCAVCGEDIKEYKNLHQKDTTFSYNRTLDVVRSTRCPHCLTGRVHTEYDIHPIKIKRVKTRELYLEPQKKTWWGKKLPRKSYTQTEAID